MHSNKFYIIFTIFSLQLGIGLIFLAPSATIWQRCISLLSSGAGIRFR
jgi:hypothetical protein